MNQDRELLFGSFLTSRFEAYVRELQYPCQPILACKLIHTMLQPLVISMESEERLMHVFFVNVLTFKKKS